MIDENTRYVIVTPHSATAEFIRAEAERLNGDWGNALHIETAYPSEIFGRTVFGNLPMRLAALAAEVIAVEFVGDAPRGREYGLKEMYEAGAYLCKYTVDNHGMVVERKSTT